MAWKFAVHQGSVVPTPDVVTHTILEGIASEVKVNVRMMRPMKIEFSVPSDHPAVATILPAGSAVHNVSYTWDYAARPYVACGGVLMAYQETSPGVWAHRFTGDIWQIQDVGDADGVKTRIVAYDPLMRMVDSPIAEYGSPTPPDAIFKETMTWTNIDAAQVISDLIEGTRDDSLITGTLETIGDITVEFKMGTVESAMRAVAEGSDCEYIVVPDPAFSSSEGERATLDVKVRLGTNKENLVKFGWDAPPHNLSRIERLEDFTTFTNNVVVIGGEALPSATSISSQITREGRVYGHALGPTAGEEGYEQNFLYGWRPVVMSYPDITDPIYIQELANARFAMSSFPKQMVKVVPQTGSAMEKKPWIDFELGDTVTVFAGARLRGGLAGVQRIYGWDIDSPEDGQDVTSAIYVSAET